MTTRADVHVQVDGDGVLVDNSWLWHADHDDCNTESDNCNSGYGMLVQGADVSVYDLKVEHVFKDHVFWKGERGQMFFLQEELPYHYLAYGSDGNVGYRVADTVAEHTAYALGVYIVGVCGNMKNVTAIRAPPTASLNNLVAWDNGADVSAFASVLCAGETCSRGRCSGSFCRLQTTSGQKPKSGEPVLITSQLSHKCLGVVEEAHGAQVEVSTCNSDNSNQQWVYMDGQIIHHTQHGLQLCLDDPVERPWGGDKLRVSVCNGSRFHQWKYDHLVGDVKFQGGSYCLESSADGTSVQIWDCAASILEEFFLKKQRWTMRAINSDVGEGWVV